MEQYVSKAALVTEIEKLKGQLLKGACSSQISMQTHCKEEAYDEVLSFLNTLEVKDEVISSDPIEAMKEALRMEYEKGRADVLRCIDPDVMVADFCSQPFSKTRSLASIYRQGITDIIKRINNNEETSTTGTLSIDDDGVR